MTYSPDPAGTATKSLAIAERVDLLVIGAGAAGVAAAIEARVLGLQTLLIDENPIAYETAAEDVPFHFGGAMGGDLRNPGRTLETIIEHRPDIAEAFEAGVDVRMGSAVLGLFVNGATLGWLPGPVALVSDGAQVTAIGFARAIVATGRRDMGLAFPGWETPGVMGVTAASLLGTTYHTLDARSFVMIGSGNEALLAAAAPGQSHHGRGFLSLERRHNRRRHDRGIERHRLWWSGYRHAGGAGRGGHGLRRGENRAGR
jgi:thioredoxin reductase